MSARRRQPAGRRVPNVGTVARLSRRRPCAVNCDVALALAGAARSFVSPLPSTFVVSVGMATSGLSLDVLPKRYLPLAVTASEASSSTGNRSWQPHVQHLILFATHTLSPLDIRLYRHYSRQLRYDQSTLARLWVLYYQPAQDGVQSLPDAAKEIEAGVCIWGDGTIRRALPALAARIAVASANTPDPNHRRYFWFHSSVLAACI